MSEEDAITGVLWDPCSKLLRWDSHILHSNADATSTIARLRPVASARLLSRVGWTPTYTAGTALLRYCVLPRYRRRGNHLSKILLVGSRGGQTTGGSWAGSYVRPRPGWIQIEYGARRRLSIRRELCTSLNGSVTHGATKPRAALRFFYLPPEPNKILPCAGTSGRSCFCRAPNLQAEPIRANTMLE